MEDKFQVHAQPRKAKKLNNIMSKLKADPVLMDNTDISKHGNRQHEIRIRLLSLLLNLSNADTSGEDINTEALQPILSASDVENNVRIKQQEELQNWRDLLGEGETSDYHSLQWNDQPLSDWTSSDDDEIGTNKQHMDSKQLISFTIDKEVPVYPNGDIDVSVILPGCVEPLKPPIKIPPPGHSVHADAKKSKQWMMSNVLPHYWIREKDGRRNTNYPLAISLQAELMNSENATIMRSSANLVKELDAYYAFVLGIPVEEKIIVTEYQIMREIIWTFMYPQLSDKSISKGNYVEKTSQDLPYPLFTYDSNKCAFIANTGWLCMPSISPDSLTTLLEIFGKVLTSLHHLASFVRNVLDRSTQESLSASECLLYPLTYEAYAAGLSNIINLFSADLIDVEKIVRDRKITFTLLDLQLRISPWSKILNCLARFHSRAVDTLNKSDEDVESRPSNWQAALRLLSCLNAAISSEFKADMYALFVDLFLKTLGPYFRIMGLWVSQGRLEDWRDEFVFAVNPEYHTSQMRLHVRNEQTMNSDEEELDVDSASDIQAYGLQETFWTRGFISRPYQSYLMAHNLKLPELFDWTLPRILTCGKSIEILTILQKQGRLEKSSALQFKYHVSFTQLYDEFLSNVKRSLEDHKIDPTGENVSNEQTIETPDQIPQVKDIIEEDIGGYDPYLVAAFDTLLSKAGGDSEYSTFNENKKEILKFQNGGKDFLLLSNYGLDPMKPLSSKLETCLMPVIVNHVDKASITLLNLFRNTLNLEEHLNFVRKVYLMESGDLLSEFYNSIFEAASQNAVQSRNQSSGSCVEWSTDSLSLTTMLHDCLYRRPPTMEDIVERFSVKVYGTLDTISNIENNIHLTYHVDWPLNIVLHSTSLSTYNKIFQFLLKIKHSLWALQQIDAKDLAAALEKAQKLRRIAIEEYELLGGSDDEDHLEIRLAKVPENKNVSKVHSNPVTEEGETKEKRKIHRILLLRSWLLHFVGNVHSYLMTRVLHTTQLELQGVLREEGEHKVKDLDDIIKYHDKYIERIHDRCFLHQSASVLRETVIKVLNTCLELHGHCTQFVNDYISLPIGQCGLQSDTEDIDLELQSLKTKKYHIYKSTKESGLDLVVSEKLLNNFEENYFRSHQFLATTLRSLAQKRNVPYLDGLAAALIHTSPNRTHS